MIKQVIIVGVVFAILCYIITNSEAAEALGYQHETCTERWKLGDVKKEISGVGKKVLVTGAAGFIGSHVAEHCLKLGMEVVGIDDLSGGFPENVPTGVDFYKVDIKDQVAVDKLFEKHPKFDFIYHLAAYAAEGLSHFVRSYNYRNNLVGGIELLNHAIKRDTTVFIFTSSIAAYGSGEPGQVFTEDVKPNPEDPYGVSKYAFELDLRAAHDMFKMNYIIFRPHNVYGPRQNIADRYRNVIGIFMNNLLNGKAMTIFGDGQQTRCFSYIADVAPIIAKSPLIPGVYNHAFNIGSDIPESLQTLAEYVGEVMDAPSGLKKAVNLPPRLEVNHAEASHNKLLCAFQHHNVTGLKKGLKLTADWVKKSTGFNPVEFSAVEVCFFFLVVSSYGCNHEENKIK